MFEINEENLKYAYQKYKNYAYYYNSSIFYKQKVIEFEKNYNENTFSLMARELKEQLLKNKSLENSGIGITILPKKDSVKVENEKIIIDKFNFFIDMPLKYYLVDILFSLELMTSTERSIYKHAYGSVFDENLYDIANQCIDDVVKNKLLFANYGKKYAEWKRQIYDYVDNNKENDYVLYKLDIEKCFYNVDFDIVDFINKIFGTNNDSDATRLIKQVYLYYTAIIEKQFDSNATKEKRHVLLPIGLFSSHIILNILFSELDEYIGEKSLVYCRYADDMLMLFNKKTFNSSDHFDINNYVDDLLVDKNEKTIINSKYFKYGQLFINNNKFKRVTYKKGTSIKKFNKKMINIIRPSLLDEEEFDDYIDFDNKKCKYDLLKNCVLSATYNSNIDNVEKINEIFNSFENEDYINIYPLWKPLIELFKTVGINIEEKIEELINSIEVYFESNKQDKYTSLTKKQLMNELYYSLYGAKNSNSIFGVTLEDTFNHIENFLYGKTTSLYPIVVTSDEISLFLSMNYEIDEDFYKTVNDIFYIINNYYDSKYIDIKKDGTLYRISSYPKLQGDPHVIYEYVKNLSIAVVSLKMPYQTIEKKDINSEYPGEYNINTIKRIIRNASNNGADMILFPEISVPYQDAYDLVKYCKKKKISIVAGLTHYIKKEKMYNYTLIMDYDLDLCICKSKNYFSPKEKFICKKYGYQYQEPREPYYLLIENERCIYTTMTCYEATSIHDRAILTDKVEVVYMPVYNLDTQYFSNIISSFVVDAGCHVAQANNSEFGDSRITGPYNSQNLDIVKLKGGENNYYVIGKIDFETVYSKHNSDDYKENVKEATVKPVMAGKLRKENRKNNKVR